MLEGHCRRKGVSGCFCGSVCVEVIRWALPQPPSQQVRALGDLEALAWPGGNVPEALNMETRASKGICPCWHPNSLCPQLCLTCSTQGSYRVPSLPLRHDASCTLPVPHLHSGGLLWLAQHLQTSTLLCCPVGELHLLYGGPNFSLGERIPSPSLSFLGTLPQP